MVADHPSKEAVEAALSVIKSASATGNLEGQISEVLTVAIFAAYAIDAPEMRAKARAEMLNEIVAWLILAHSQSHFYEDMKRAGNAVAEHFGGEEEP